jgi:hypothetical protein
VKLDDIRARNALSLIATFLGGPQYRDTQLGDTRRFSLDLEAGTILDLMNAAAKAHGELVWSFQTMSGDSPFPYIVTMHSGMSGTGCGVPGTAPVEPVDIASFADPVVLSDNGSASILDRIVGTKSDGSAIVLNGPYPSAIRDLAKATKVPMGVEFLGPGKRPLTGSIHATGNTLRWVLDAIVAVDSRYEWRELQGVIVVRPATAWNDPEHLFSKSVPAVRLIDVSPQAAVERLAKQLGHPDPLAGIPHGKLLSIDAPPSTVFDLANAILRAHGELTWELSPETHRESIEQGYRYTLTFGVMGGGGLGFGVRP